MLAVVLRWTVRVVVAVVIYGALAAGLLAVWMDDGPMLWALICTPVFALVGVGAAVWMTESL